MSVGTVNMDTLDKAAPSPCPRRAEEAASQIDRTGWVVVSNPDPADRLHLRTEPDRGAESLGKFYNETPVQVLSQKGEWSEVRVGLDGLRGRMMTKHLAFGEAMDAVKTAFPQLTYRDEHDETRPAYDSKACKHVIQMDKSYDVIGVVEDALYILLTDLGQTGYVSQECCMRETAERADRTGKCAAPPAAHARGVYGDGRLTRFDQIYIMKTHDTCDMRAGRSEIGMKHQIRRLACLALALAMLVTVALAEETPDLKDDFYEAINAQWLAETEIPSDSSTVSAFSQLSDSVKETLTADFQAMLSGEKDVPEELTDFIEFYRLAADYETRGALGAEPLAPYLERIENIESLDAFCAVWTELFAEGLPVPIFIATMADMKNSTVNALYMYHPGLFLFSKDYYLDDATRTAMQDEYGQMSVNLLVMAGKTQEEAQQIVSGALAFDERIAAYAFTAEENSDITASYNPVSLAELDAQVEILDLSAGLERLLGEVPETVILVEKDYFAGLDDVITEETFPDMKNWMIVNTVNALAFYLTDDFRVEAGAFERAFSGMAEAEPAGEAAYALAASAFKEVVGIYYGKTYFGEEARSDVRDMVEMIVEVYKERLANNDWLSASTREMAIRKLEAMTVNVGYPDEPDPLYARLKTVPASEGGTLLDNAMAFSITACKYNLEQYGQSVNRGKWALSANTVNAMYSLFRNSINFPAAILQEPFYSPEQSASANYGAIGAVIAHEISHAFDPNGSKFDENGSLLNWWTEEDLATFHALSQAMIEEFDGLDSEGGKVNGSLTVTENVADAGGLSCALEALKKAEEEPDLKAFCIGWARVWRSKATPEYNTMLLTLDVHAPNKLRANIQLQNLDDFFTAFGIEEGDGMYRAPEDRVSIW